MPQLQTPTLKGEFVSGCNSNSAKTACIYEKSPVAQKNASLDVSSLESFTNEMQQIQTYSVNLTDTTNNQLQNTHYDVIMELKDSSDTVYPRVQLSSTRNKWTSPYKANGENSAISDFSLEQVMTYYYLMYLKEYMELNAGQWYASNKSIKAVAFGTEAGAYWSERQNKLVMGREWNCRRFDTSSNKPAECHTPVGLALSGGIVVHEAGHANLSHSLSSQRTGSICNNHTVCSENPAVPICDHTGHTLASNQICCTNQKGCFFAFNEGQADFHATLLFPDAPQTSEFYLNTKRGGGFQCSDFPLYSNPKTNSSVTASDIFNKCGTHNRPQGQVHVMAVLYNSMWYAIYIHTGTNPRDIVKLFAEHLPLISLNDDFETAGTKIINLAKQIWASPDTRGQSYAQIIEAEFKKRGFDPLNPSSSAFPERRLTHFFQGNLLNGSLHPAYGEKQDVLEVVHPDWSSWMQ